MIQTKPDNKSNKKNKLIKTLILIFIIAMIAIMVIIAYCLSVDKNPEQDNLNQVTCHIGEEFEFDGLKITINSWEITDRLLNSSNFKAKEGYKWVVLNATIFNPTSKTISLTEGEFFPTRKYTTTLIYSDQYKYNQTYYNYLDWISTHDDIMPLGKINGIYSYLVPDSVTTQDSLKWLFTFNKVAEQNQNVTVILR